MKVLHINSYYTDGSFYRNLYELQIQDGNDIKVYVPTSYNKSNSNCDDYIAYSKAFNKYERIFFHIKQKKILNDVKSKFVIHDFDIIHAHSLFTNGYVALRLKKQFNVPYIVAVRNTDLNIFFRYMLHLRKLGIEIMKEADKIIFLSKSYRDFFASKYLPEDSMKEILDKVVIIPNGIDRFWFNNLAKNKSTPANSRKLKIMYAGTINKNKNLKATIKAIKIFINETGFQVDFNVVGNVADKRIFNFITRQSFVHYFKPRPKEDLIEIYRKSDIFIMPSKTETFGLVYAEAMSQGLPVIYTKGQGFDGQFEDGQVGYAVVYNKPRDIAEKIIDIINNYDKISINCISNTGKFRWENIHKSYIEIYNSILVKIWRKHDTIS